MSRLRNNHRRRSGFSMTELLVVMAIIGILIGLLLPAIQMVREIARTSECKNNLRQIGLGLINFHDANRAFPPAHFIDPLLNNVDYGQPQPYGDKANFISWHARILPYIGETILHSYADYKDDYPWPNGERLPNGNYVNGEVVRLFQCPNYPNNRGPYRGVADPAFGECAMANTDYLGVNGTNQFGTDPSGVDRFNQKHLGILYVNSKVRADDVKDGLSQTFLVGERPRTLDDYWGLWFADSGMFPWWGAAGVVLGTEECIPDNNGIATPSSNRSHFQEGHFKFEFDGFSYDNNAWHFWSPHVGGAHFLFADGHVEFVSYSINQDLFRARGTYMGGETNNGQ